MSNDRALLWYCVASCLGTGILFTRHSSYVSASIGKGSINVVFLCLTLSLCASLCLSLCMSCSRAVSLALSVCLLCRSLCLCASVCLALSRALCVALSLGRDGNHHNVRRRCHPQESLCCGSGCSSGCHQGPGQQPGWQ